mmetsp:Transcript_6578/g.19531  ORF Transcript_6578/g.19531 Transcript_6578/m.19531 type:complete len:256 (+) Transcript_6578:1100-1867(+)
MGNVFVGFQTVDLHALVVVHVHILLLRYRKNVLVVQRLHGPDCLFQLQLGADLHRVAMHHRHLPLAAPSQDVLAVRREAAGEGPVRQVEGEALFRNAQGRSLQQRGLREFLRALAGPLDLDGSGLRGLQHLALNQAQNRLLVLPCLALQLSRELHVVAPRQLLGMRRTSRVLPQARAHVVGPRLGLWRPLFAFALALALAGAFGRGLQAAGVQRDDLLWRLDGRDRRRARAAAIASLRHRGGRWRAGGSPGGRQR